MSSSSTQYWRRSSSLSGPVADQILIASKALESQTWDASVKSLVPFPQVLTMLDKNLS
jgi:hypothetical protein